MVMKILILTFFFEIKGSKITRGHHYTLVKKQSRLDVRKFSYSKRTIADMPPGTDCPYPIRILAFFEMIQPYHVVIRI